MGYIQDLMDEQDFILNIEDKDMQRYIAVNNNSKFSYIKHVDNEDKVAMYSISNYLMCNKSNVYFRKSMLESYIVYDKKTKKVNMSKPEIVYNAFLQKYFYNTEAVSCFMRFKLTKTFVKKVIEGKIQTIRDIMKYYNSYVTSIKIDEVVTAQLMINSKQDIIKCVSDPENLTGSEGNIYGRHYIKVKCSELKNYKKIQDEWEKTQINRISEFITKGGFSDCERIVQRFKVCETEAICNF